MPPDAVARSVAHLPRRKIWQRYAFAFNPVKLSLFALAYLVAYEYGTLFLQTAAAPLWFPDSVLLCALLLTPANEWWLYLAIAVPIRLIPTPHPAIPLWFVFATSANDLIKATFAAYLLRRLPNGSSHPSTMPQLGTFLGVGVFVVPILSAFAGAATRHLLGYGFWVSWYQWFLGDATAKRRAYSSPAVLVFETFPSVETTHRRARALDRWFCAVPHARTYACSLRIFANCRLRSRSFSHLGSHEVRPDWSLNVAFRNRTARYRKDRRKDRVIFNGLRVEKSHILTTILVCGVNSGVVHSHCDRRKRLG